MKLYTGSTFYEVSDNQIVFYTSDGEVKFANNHVIYPIYHSYQKIIPENFSNFENHVVDGKVVWFFIGTKELKKHNLILDVQRKLNKKFTSLIKNRSVIYVGPSPILEGRSMGKFIDSFDVVVRSNNMYKVPRKLWKDYGKKCDIVFFIDNYLKREECLDIDFINKKEMIVISKKTIDQIDHNLTVDPSEIRSKLKNKNILTGLYTIEKLLEKKPKFLHVTGIDFYLNEKMHVTSYTTSDTLKEIYDTNHDTDDNIKYFLKNIMRKVNIDAFLLKLLKDKKYL